MRYIIKIKDWYYFKRRIPKRYQTFYGDTTVLQVSLKTTSEAVAIQRAAILKEEVEAIWQSLSHKDNATPSEYEKAVNIAQTYNFNYRTQSELESGPIERIIERANVIAQEEKPTEDVINALLGGISPPKLTLSKALDEFFEFEAPNLKRKDKNQIRKWRNPRIKAVNNFIQICGDKHVEDITRNDILDFRTWWRDRIDDEGLTPNSPNKDFTHLRGVLYYARDNYDIDLKIEDLFSRIRFKEIKNSRPPFETPFIQDELLNPRNLRGLDKECQLFLYAMADLGARPSEIVGLNPKKGDIRLDTDIPYISIHADKDKEIKTAYSERVMPLVGASLYAFQNISEGFQRYYRKPDQLSANLNKFLRSNNLLPTEDHSVYSLRHSFEDRLTAVEPPDKVQAALMGHKYDRPRYGDGPSLEQKQKWLLKIALTPPNR